MAREIPLRDQELSKFISNEKGRVQSYLRKTFSISDDDVNDIYQESSIALYQNIRDGRLSNLTSSLSTYFLRICINQTLKFVGKRKKVVPLFDDSSIAYKDVFRSDKIDELYQLCTEDDEQATLSRSEKIVNSILQSMPDTCRNIFHGYYWDDLTTNTIADMYGFSNANSVKTQKYKCVDKFRKKYNELMSKKYGKGQ